MGLKELNMTKFLKSYDPWIGMKNEAQFASFFRLLPINLGHEGKGLRIDFWEHWVRIRWDIED
jgi:hypothetical protein